MNKKCETREWSQPSEISNLQAAFPASVRHLMPRYEDIPDDFRRHGGRGDAAKWVKAQNAWFFGGIKKSQFIRKSGVDAEKAFRHLAAIQGSFEPKHEHKEAAVAYLASPWFDDVRFCD